MLENSRYPNPWIGHSQWRTLISLEGEVISQKTAAPVQGSEGVLNALWPEHQMDKVFHIYPIAQLEAAVFFLAGQSFLINTPKGVFQSLDAWANTPPARIILLSWEDKYIDGLIEYCYACAQLPQPQQLEIYVSEWGWDCIKNRAWNQLLCNKQSVDKTNLYQFFLNAIEPYPLSTEGEISLKRGITPIIFKKNAHYRLFPQIEWWMNYSLAKEPCLQVQFRLFDSYLTFTHHQPYPSKSYLTEILIPITQQYPSAAIELQRVINQRLGDIINLKDLEGSKGGSKFNIYPSFYTYNVFSKSLNHVDSEEISGGKCLQMADILPKQLKNNDFDLQQITPKNKEVKPPLTLKSAKALSWAALEEKAEKAKEKDSPKTMDAPRIFLAISCGGLSTASNGKVTPTTRVSINKMNLSLLGFKMYDLLKDLNSSRPIFQKKLILLVSPWTEANVRQEVSHLLWEFRNEFKVVLQAEDIIYLRQTVVPCCVEENGQLKYYEKDGFQFNPAGHFDFLRLLMDETNDIKDFLKPSEKENTAPCSPTLIYHTIYKNLGRNIDEKVRLLADYVARATTPAFLFELVRHHSGEDVGSYWVTDRNATENGQQKWLTKPLYKGKNGFEYSPATCMGTDKLFIEKEDAETGLLMSTASFMVNMGQLRRAKTTLKKLPFFATNQRAPRLVLAADNTSVGENLLPEILQFERDIDQISEQIPCEGVEIESNRHGITPRFIPIKKEKDLYQNKVKILEQIWKGELKEDKEFKKALPAHTPFLLEPDEKHDTWGGHRIRYAKEQREVDEKVSETWEASLHHKGVSGIKYDALNSVPLSTFLEDCDLNIMFKLLDCNSWLSIQLHPSSSTFEALTQHLTTIEQEALTANWASDDIDKVFEALNNREDNYGKEEVFYIVDNKNYLADHLENEPNLILGLHKEKLENLSFLSEEEWRFYKKTFRTDNSFDKDLFKAFKKDIIEKSAFWMLDTFVQAPSVALSEKYQVCFSTLIDKHLPFILRLRQETTDTSLLGLRGILFILSVQAIKEALQLLKPADLQRAFGQSKLPLFDFFHKICPKPGSILRVKPGMIHALGKGLFAVEASNHSNNTFRIFDHGRELSSAPRPLHYLLAAVSLSQDSFISKKNEQEYVFPQGDFIAKDNIQLSVFKSDQLRQVQEISFSEKEGLLVLCTKGISRIKTTYTHLETGISNTTTLDLKEAYTAYIPPGDKAFKRTVTVEANTDAAAECVAASAIAQRNNVQKLDRAKMKQSVWKEEEAILQLLEKEQNMSHTMLCP